MKGAVVVAPNMRGGTLQPADVGPLLLLHHGPLELGAKGHVIHVVQQDADHLAREMLQPGDGDHLTELQGWRETSTQHRSMGRMTPKNQRQLEAFSSARFSKDKSPQTTIFGPTACEQSYTRPLFDVFDSPNYPPQL